MAATCISRGTYREVWQELVPLPGGQSRTITTGIKITPDQLSQTFGLLQITGTVNSPLLTTVISSIGGYLAVTITNSAAVGDTATYTLDIFRMHSVQQKFDVVGAGQVHVVGAATAGVPLGNTVVTEQAYGQAPTAGAAAIASRTDHTHGTPSLSNTVVPEQAFALSPDAGTGLTASRSDHTHGTPPWVGEVIEVAKSGGQYTSVATAIANIPTPPTATNPWLIRVAAGDYTEPPFTIPAYVKVQGAGWVNTILRQTPGTVGLFNFITLAGASTLRDVGIYGATGIGLAAVYHAPAADPRPASIVEIAIAQGYYGVHTSPTVLASNLLMQTVAYAYDAATPAMNTLVHADGLAAPIASQILATAPANRIGTAISCNGAGVSGTFVTSQHSVSGATTGVLVDNGAVIRLLSCRFATGQTAIHVGAGGASIMGATGCLIQQLIGGYTNHILIDSAAATIMYSGIADSSRIDNAVGSTLTVTIADLNPASRGQTTIGEASVGYSYDHLTPTLAYGVSTWLTGLVSGGGVTRAGGLILNVAAGVGFINDGFDTSRIAFGPGATTALAANSTEWIYVTAAGALAHSAIVPDYGTNIVLAVAATDGANVVLLSGDEINIQHQASRLQEYFEEVIGPINITGAATQINVGAPTRIDITGGEFFVGLNERDVIAASAVPFYYWYKTGATWTKVAATDIDTVHYNNVATGLVDLSTTANHWKKDLVFITVGGDGTEVHVVYGQQAFVDQAAAEQGAIPAAPDILNYCAQRSMGVVVHDSDVAITSMVDYRPKIGQQAGITVPPTGDHNLLLNLAAPNNDHQQYLTTIVGAPNEAGPWLLLQPGNNTNLVSDGNLHNHDGVTGGAQIDHDDLSNNGGAGSHVTLGNHLTDFTNPHSTNYTQVGAPPDTRLLTAGTGMTGGGDLTADRTFNVVANADGSIIANAGDIQVGVLATDGQHGVRGGGTQHAAVVAGVSNGFMTAADKTKLDSSGVLSLVAPANVTKAAADAGVAPEASRRDHKHDITTAAPAAKGVDTASGEGAATTLARSDHWHQSNTAPGNVTKAAAQIGTSPEPARADHKHDITTAAPTATGVATIPADGVATTLARSDHAHQSNTAPVDVDRSAAVIGGSGEPARADHKHDVSTAAPGATSVATASAAGAAATLAKSDHVHQSNTAASTIGTANSVGTSGEPARADHGHDHGAQALGAGTQHAAVTTAVNGFMAATDKLKLDRMRSVRLAAPQSNASTTWADVAGLSFVVEANKTYRFVFDVIFQSTVVGTGIGFGVNGPAGPTSITTQETIPLTLAGNVQTYATRAYSTGAGTGNTTTSVDSTNSDLLAVVEGVLVNGANAGTLSLAFRSENANSVSVRAGSVGIIQEIA
jgi:hypothetical protein